MMVALDEWMHQQTRPMVARRAVIVTESWTPGRSEVGTVNDISSRNEKTPVT